MIQIYEHHILSIVSYAKVALINGTIRHQYDDEKAPESIDWQQKDIADEVGAQSGRQLKNKGIEVHSQPVHR